MVDQSDGGGRNDLANASIAAPSSAVDAVREEEMAKRRKRRR